MNNNNNNKLPHAQSPRSRSINPQKCTEWLTPERLAPPCCDFSRLCGTDDDFNRPKRNELIVTVIV